MLELTVPDMTCGHCMNAITRAVGEIDSHAKLDFDLPSHRVSVDSDKAAADIRAAIEQAGYTVRGPEQDAQGVSCCGTCHP